MGVPNSPPTLADIDDERREAERDATFWDAHYAEFVTKYPDQFVAARDGHVVAAAGDLHQLVAILSAQSIAPQSVTVRFVTAHPAKLLL